MDARNFAKTRNYINEVKYESQIYWFVIISLLLALILAYSPLRDASSSVDKKLQLPTSIFSDVSVASEEKHISPRVQFSRSSENGYMNSYSQGGT